MSQATALGARMCQGTFVVLIFMKNGTPQFHTPEAGMRRSMAVRRIRS